MSSTRTINKLLVANRGEIACRIFRCAKSMGIRTVAVYSEADECALHTRSADEAVCIGPASSRDSYLNVASILQAAERVGADAVHPGYGFLSENADFAEACQKAGLLWVGPKPETISELGSKERSKEIAIAAEVPVIPSFSSEDLAGCTFPLLVKASAGGGGKGMHIVNNAEELPAIIESTKRLAESAFGDGTILLEPYLAGARHVEIQILADNHGQVMHLFERDCSVQRRHQKVIEEAPALGLTNELREKMGAAAVRLAKQTGYLGAGTVEFLLHGEDFYFLEVNTRLQVEHPVTEMITGVDLVREQIRIASGLPISFAADTLSISGHAIECRLYAEDPKLGDLPSCGTITHWIDSSNASGIRLDSGLEAGDQVTPHYDPMLAKIIAHGADRDEALRRMQRYLEGLLVQGVQTNRDLLLQILGAKEFQRGEVDTKFLESAREGFAARVPSEEEHFLAAVAVTLHSIESRPRPLLPHLPLGFRNSTWRPQERRFLALQSAEGEEISVQYRQPRSATKAIEILEPKKNVVLSATIRCTKYPHYVLTLDGQAHSLWIASKHPEFVQDSTSVLLHGNHITLREQSRFPERRSEVEEAGCVAPMPGSIVALHAEPGQKVRSGQTIAVLEAMKMEHELRAHRDGILSEVRATVGQQVESGAVVAVIEAVSE